LSGLNVVDSGDSDASLYTKTRREKQVKVLTTPDDFRDIIVTHKIM